ncbi:MAG TPA: response regulator transcription factor [Pirellulaceae bacterium]|jgi:DNA-binding NarL/FixJ family response regulator|nr:response regulator transcription factor [Pirellulaceae bacterium]
MNAVERPFDRAVTFLLVDDHEMYRIGMRRLIEKQPGWKVIGEAASPEDAMHLAGELHPQVAIVDLRLKDGDGMDLVRKMHAADPTVRLLISSVNDEELFADRCLQAGASGYVAKGQPAEVLVAAVEKALAGGIYLSEEMTDRMVTRTAGRRKAVFPLDTLTPREREVYAMIGHGQSVKQIAGALHLSAKTVEYHRQQLKKKLQLSSSAALARHATVNPLQTGEA